MIMLGHWLLDIAVTKQLLAPLPKGEDIVDKNKDLISAPVVREAWLKGFLVDGLLSAPSYKIDTPDCRIKLDQNESPWDWPEPIKQEICEKLATVPWNRYPSTFADHIAKSIAGRLNVDPDMVLMSPGSNYLVALVLSTFTRQIVARFGVEEAARRVIIARPSFALYESHCRYDGIPYTTWDLNGDLEYDLKQLPPLLPGSVVCFASPNNPVGNVLKYEDFELLLAKNPESFFIADEAYAEFAERPYHTLLKSYNNFIILRTFSKIMGAAGLRIGFALGPKEIILNLRKLRVPYLLNQHALVASAAAFANPKMEEFFQKILNNGIQERERVYRGLQDISNSGGFSVKNSQANFILVRYPSTEKSNKAYQAMVNEGVLVRNVSSSPGLGGCLRVTVGAPDENAAFLSAAKRVWAHL